MHIKISRPFRGNFSDKIVFKAECVRASRVKKNSLKRSVEFLSSQNMFLCVFHPHMVALTLNPLGVLIPRLFKKKKHIKSPCVAHW